MNIFIEVNIYMSSKGQQMDKYLTMYSDFFVNTVDFMVKNIDKVLMMVIICFLLHLLEAILMMCIGTG